MGYEIGVDDEIGVGDEIELIDEIGVGDKMMYSFGGYTCIWLWWLFIVLVVMHVL